MGLFSNNPSTTTTTVMKTATNNRGDYTPHTNTQEALLTTDGTPILQQTRPLTDLKFLTLGSSVSWGAGLPNRYKAYPYLLSSNPSDSTNLAVRAAGPKYPSVCLQSMLLGDKKEEKEQEYDVIVLEYYFKSKDGLYDLTSRLRIRYPDAIIILLRLWMPVHLLVMDEHNKEVGVLKDWALQHSLDIHSHDFATEIRHVQLAWPNEEITHERNAEQERAMQDFSCHLFIMDGMDLSPKEALQQNRDYFSSDYSHLSDAGHYYVYQNILRIVYREIHNQPYPLTPRIGSWGFQYDACVSWYESGSCPLVHSSNVYMDLFDPRGMKYAITTSSAYEEGWIMVHNPFDTEQNVVLSFMASGPPPSIYPKVEVVMDTDISTSGEMQSKVINPVSNYYPYKVHIVVSAKIGVIAAGGEARVIWKPIREKEIEGKQPFRIIALAVVGTHVEEGGVLGATADFTFLD